MARLVWAVVLTVYAGVCCAHQQETIAERLEQGVAPEAPSQMRSTRLEELTTIKERLERDVRPDICSQMRSIRGQMLDCEELTKLQRNVSAARRKVLEHLASDEVVLEAQQRVKRAREKISARLDATCRDDAVMKEFHDRILLIESRLEELAFERRKANFMLHEARRIARKDPRIAELGEELQHLRQAMLDNPQDPQALRNMRLATKAFNEALVSATNETEIGSAAMGQLADIPFEVQALRAELRAVRERMWDT